LKEKQKTYSGCKSPSLLRDDKANSNTDLKSEAYLKLNPMGKKEDLSKPSTPQIYPKTECLPGRKFPHI